MKIYIHYDSLLATDHQIKGYLFPSDSEMSNPLFIVPFTSHFTIKGKRLLEIDNAAPAFCKDHVDGMMP